MVIEKLQATDEVLRSQVAMGAVLAALFITQNVDKFNRMFASVVITTR